MEEDKVQVLELTAPGDKGAPRFVVTPQAVIAATDPPAAKPLRPVLRDGFVMYLRRSVPVFFWGQRGDRCARTRFPDDVAACQCFVRAPQALLERVDGFPPVSHRG